MRPVAEAMPTPENPGGVAVRPTVPAGVAAIDPNKTVVVGRSDRRETVNAVQLYEKVASAPDNIKRRMLLAMGYSVDTHPDTGAPTLIKTDSPRSFAQVAGVESKLTGRLVSAQAVGQSLLARGITEDAINKTIGGAAPESVSDAEVGLGASDAGEDNIPGMRVEATAAKAFSAGVTEGGGKAPTLDQRAAERAANMLLKEDSAHNKGTQGVEADVVILDAGELTSEEAEALAQHTIDANAEAALAMVEADAALALWHDPEVSIRDMPRRLQANWIIATAEIAHAARQATITGDAFSIDEAMAQAKIELKRDFHDINDRVAKNQDVPALSSRGKTAPRLAEHTETSRRGGADSRGSLALDGRHTGSATDVETTLDSIPDVTARAQAKWTNSGQKLGSLTAEELEAFRAKANKLGNATLVDSVDTEVARRTVNRDVLGPDQATANAVNRDMNDGKADLPFNADVVICT